MTQKTCPDCNKSYARLGAHWKGDCNAPQFSEKQLDVVIGLLMGDAWLKRDCNSMLSVKMTNREYLEYLEEVFGVLGTGVSKEREYDNPNWNTSYYWSTRSHKQLNQFDSWYDSGNKVWPETIELTPTVLKHWYVGDGHLEKRGNSQRVRIGVSNESGNSEKIAKMFKNVGLKYSRWDEYETEDGRMTANINFGVDETEQLFNYMGEPLPGFENKWPEV